MQPLFALSLRSVRPFTLSALRFVCFLGVIAACLSSPACAAHWAVYYQASGTDTGVYQNSNLPYNQP